MLYSYFYTLDEVLDNDAYQAQLFDIQKFIQSLKETLWNMGEALWIVED